MIRLYSNTYEKGRFNVKRKLTALVIAFVMLAIPASASLGRYDVIPEGKEDGSLVTRLEMVKYTVRLRGLGEAAEAAVGDTAFSDVGMDDDFSGYINIAEQSGIINGMGDGTFRADDNVTLEQAVKMLMAAIGYTPMAESFGGYPTGYILTAAQMGVTRGVSGVGSDAITLAQAKTLLENALYTPVMEQTTWSPEGAGYEIMEGEDYIKTPEISFLNPTGFHIIGENNGIILSAADFESADFSEGELILTISEDKSAVLVFEAEELRAIYGGRIVARFTADEMDANEITLTVEEDDYIEDVLRDVNVSQN